MRTTVTKNLIAAAIAVALVVGGATDVSAESGPMLGPGRDHCGRPADNGGGRIARLTDELKLTPEQQARVRVIFEDERMTVQRLRTETRKRIDDVLTDAQRTERDTLIKQRLDKQVDRLAKRLSLSDEQTAKIRAIVGERRSQPELGREVVKERIVAVLTPEQLREFESEGPRGDRHGGHRRGPKDGPRDSGFTDGPPDAPLSGPEEGPEDGVGADR